jgi:2-polyprenyl-3-methyl-5-hydroxy-6-metoxy-1,4-benzoquinol methylase
MPGMPCGAQSFVDDPGTAHHDSVTLDVYQCARCGLVQLTSAPVRYYREVIRAAAISPEMRAFRKNQFDAWTARHNLKAKRVLEIGCGKGEYLEIMQQAGASAHGIEYAAASVAACKAKNLTVTQAFIDHSTTAIPGGLFDGFFILNFLEHLPDPGMLLRGIAHNLRDEGVGLVEVPNFDMIAKHGLCTEFVSDHLTYFTRETLSTLLALNGFAIIDSDTVWHDYIISATVVKRKAVAMDTFHQNAADLKRKIDVFIGDASPESVAVWGAGHQALTILALTALRNKIGCVIDSAAFKQGKYTPATHIPIVSPEVLAQGAITTVLIMAASYSDEIVRIIREHIQRPLRVAVVRNFDVEIL